MSMAMMIICDKSHDDEQTLKMYTDILLLFAGNCLGEINQCHNM